jgi:SPP1 gp7 family putative phage head morphogenesis protein
MSNPNQDIFDATVRHRIALERYSAQDSKKVLRWLEDLKTDIQARLVRATPSRRAQLDDLLDDVRSLHADTYRRIQGELTGRWRTLSGSEADFTAEKLRGAGIEASITRLTTDAAFQAAMARPMEGAMLKDWLSQLDSAARARLDRSLTISFTEGESLDRAVKRIQETIDINKRSAQTLIRTANTHISNSVQQASAEANSDIVKEVEWRSVLDSRTTPICQTRDGERYPVSEGPRPPAHPGCRSIIIEILDGFPPPDRETYSEWLERQSPEVQDEVLGPTRGKLLREGKVKVSEFTTDQGKLIPLNQLSTTPDISYTLPALPRELADAVNTVLTSHPELSRVELEDFAGRYAVLAQNYAAVKRLPPDPQLVPMHVFMVVSRWRVNKQTPFSTVSHLNSWTFNGNDWLMEALRNPATTPNVRNVALATQRKLDDAIRDWTSAEPAVVAPTYRGVTRKFANKIAVSQAKVGDVVDLGEPTATSLRKDFAIKLSENDGTVIFFRNAKSRSIEQLSYYPGEEEVLLPSTTRVRVVARRRLDVTTGMQQRARTRIEIEVEILNE